MNEDSFKTELIEWLVIVVLAAAFVALIFCGCAAPQYSPVPPASSWTNSYPGDFRGRLKNENCKLQIANLMEEKRRRTAFAAAVQSQAVAPARKFSLIWDYPVPLPQSNLVFEIHCSPKLPPIWQHWTNAVAPPVPIETAMASGFFIMRASNTVTHEVSDWNR